MATNIAFLSTSAGCIVGGFVSAFPRHFPLEGGDRWAKTNRAWDGPQLLKKKAGQMLPGQVNLSKKGEELMKRTLTLSLLLLTVASALIGLGTYAAFNDTETSSGNSFAAGTMDLKVNGGDNPAAIITVADTFPGDSGSAMVTLDNDGSIDGSMVDIATNNVTSTGGAGCEYCDGNADLQNAITINIYTAGDPNPIYTGPISGASAVLGPLAAHSGTTCTITWEVAGASGNEIQGDSVSFDLVFSLVQ